MLMAKSDGYIHPQANISSKLTAPLLVSQDELAAFELTQTQSLPSTPTPQVLSKLFTAAGIQSGTTTTLIGNVTKPGILKSWCMSAAHTTGAINFTGRFRIDIDRQGTTVFTVEGMVGGINRECNISGTPLLILLSGDIVNLVTIVDCACETEHFGSVVIQPFR